MTTSDHADHDWLAVLKRVDEVRWELPAEYMYGMRVPGLIYASETLMQDLATDNSIQQVANVATLPGIVGHSMAMPDIHWGYGFPIGGVAATRVEDGVVSPGGVGFDINCGVRLLRTSLMEADVAPKLKELLDQCFRDIPVGAGGRAKGISAADEEGILREGAAWAVRMNYGITADLEMIESRGALAAAEPRLVSERARQRGRTQLGTLGSGNHFMEIQVVEQVFDEPAARAFGIDQPGRVCAMIHTGSRGLGHQVCQDFLGRMQGVMREYRIDVPDKQLACAPVRSDAGRQYLGAMAAAANFAWANRQAITAAVRNAFHRVLGVNDPYTAITVVYDVSHNMAKIERHQVEGVDTELCVHRKGATRTFPAGNPELPLRYTSVGQPVLVPGDMGRYSFVCVGVQRAMQETWGSSCHGAGRLLSRGAAKRELAGVDIAGRLRDRGIAVSAQSQSALAEESSEAYKDVREVVHVLAAAGIARIVARLRPLGVIKG